MRVKSPPRPTPSPSTSSQRAAGGPPSSAAAAASTTPASTPTTTADAAHAPAAPPARRPLFDHPPSSTRSAGPSSALAAFAARFGDAAPVPDDAGGPSVARVPADLVLQPGSGAKRAKTRADFDALAKIDDVPGAAGVKAVKFLVTDVDTTRPRLWLIDANAHAYHFDFATRGLGMPVDLRTFNAQTYFSDARRNVAGTIVAHDAYVDEATGAQGLFAVEFWPTDPVAARHVNKAFDKIAAAMPFAQGRLAYHPAGDTQEALLQRDRGAYKRMKVPVVTTEQLFRGVTFSALNQGTGYGVLRVVDSAHPEASPPTARDVVLFKGGLPNDVAHVAGILTETPQTPLSHINLKAKQNDTPNAYLKDAAAKYAHLVGKVVKMDVGPEGVTLVEATKAEADAFLESKRPAHPQAPARDLTRTTIEDLDALGHQDLTAYGAKTANLAELRKVLGPEMVPDGYGVPFAFYDAFMKHNGLYDEARAMMADPAFRDDPQVRDEKLAAFRKRIKKAEVPAALKDQLGALQAKFPADQPIRCRSSTNNEDLEGFNGAGLYDSSTHRPDEGHLESTVKKVWASLWNFRAYEEREFWRIDHLQAAMAVTVHPNMDDEQANGVAITRNIYDANWPGFYVNAQVGEALVTNPGPADVPDELLVSAIGKHGEYEVQYIRRSSLSEEEVVPRDKLMELVAAMEKIQAHFKRLYDGGDAFAMDLEFKIDRDGKLVVKQARPVVE